MTWNLWWRFADPDRRGVAILDVLRRERPDVVGLQEVWARDGVNQAERLAAELGMHWTWAPFATAGRWRARVADEPGTDVGVAVLSRWPVTARAVQALPEPPGRAEGRVALHTLVDAPSGPLPFFTTHLHSALDGSAVRCAQVRALAGFVARHADGPAGGTRRVVTGDLNADPDSDEVRLLGGHRTAPAAPGMLLVDAWAWAAPDEPSATWDATNPHTAATFPLSARVDYVFVGWPGVRSVRRAGARPVDGVWPSDHTAVIADLT